MYETPALELAMATGKSDNLAAGKKNDIKVGEKCVPFSFFDFSFRRSLNLSLRDMYGNVRSLSADVYK